jgi:hypothetical protein
MAYVWIDLQAVLSTNANQRNSYNKCLKRFPFKAKLSKREVIK